MKYIVKPKFLNKYYKEPENYEEDNFETFLINWFDLLNTTVVCGCVVLSGFMLTIILCTIWG